ncbi:glycosyltransferase [Pseudoalteromonas sp.]|uniref:glycosyltransferase n=1 Tax=Pseudoalteromonas sp. TaxID=53249 RepID=UPI0035675329
MNNIIQLIQHPYIGGLEKMAFGLCCSELKDSNMFLVALEGTKKDAIADWNELAQLDNFYCLNKAQGMDWQTVKNLVEMIDNYRIKVIHSHHIGPMLYASLVKRMRPEVQHIHTLHDAWYLTDFKYRMFTKLIDKFSPITIVADAEAVADVAKSKANVVSDYIVHNGIDTDYFKPSSRYSARLKLGLPSDNIIIGCAARIEKGKGHKAMLRALNALPATVHMAFAGDGSLLADLKEYALYIGVSDRVHWLGCVHDMPIFYSAIDVFCLYSEREGLPLSILEAMACNRPIVASDVGGISEVVNDKLGFVLPIENEHLLAPSLLAALKLNNGMDIRQYALAQATLKVMAQDYNKIYQTILV